jgi:carbamoyl-phosphate synthase large subunit
VRLALEALEHIGLPAIIRPAFTWAAPGAAWPTTAPNTSTLPHRHGRLPVGQILVDESLLGWKEFEMEVVRDRADNAIIVCSIENVDPMGVHTGDSITVAPALTLTDKEYQAMRNGSIAVLREIGVETGGSNVQWAINPADGRMVVIEMNPRVSRSSALASKATGFPIAKVAAKLAVGYTLDELDNDITKVTPASFEPTIDYVVTKIPRFAFEKFPGAQNNLTTAMKSVGEAMAIGRTIHESSRRRWPPWRRALPASTRSPSPARPRSPPSSPPSPRPPRPPAHHRPGHAPRPLGRRDQRRHEVRPLVPRPHPRDRGHRVPHPRDGLPSPNTACASSR